MRILGDLRWDELTSKEEWKKKFPECLNDPVRNPGYALHWTGVNCKDFVVGGIHLSPYVVILGENTGTETKTMATIVNFRFFDDSSSRAFKSAIAQKYSFTTSGYCSKFTCWDLGDVDKAGSITAKPTPYTVSILDNVKVDKSDI